MDLTLGYVTDYDPASEEAVTYPYKYTIVGRGVCPGDGQAVTAFVCAEEQKLGCGWCRSWSMLDVAADMDVQLLLIRGNHCHDKYVVQSKLAKVDCRLWHAMKSRSPSQLRHLRHAAQRICVPAHMLAVIKNLHEDDEYVLVDELKQAAVSPTRGVKQGCPLSPLLFALYINDIDRLAEGAEGAVTGTEGARVTHMLYALHLADGLSFTTNMIDHLQCMLDRLRGYAARKGLTANAAKSEVMHFNSRAGSQVPTFREGKGTFRYGEDQLANTDSFEY
eukprot:1160677-Pelagomonas_calceolata.AAC.1